MLNWFNYSYVTLLTCTLSGIGYVVNFKVFKTKTSYKGFLRGSLNTNWS